MFPAYVFPAYVFQFEQTSGSGFNIFLHVCSINNFSKGKNVHIYQSLEISVVNKTNLTCRTRFECNPLGFSFYGVL